jgi:glycosyltransferase involved in cell wall biosynthesis
MTVATTLRMAFIALEFADPIFSGNGVLARSIVAGFVRQGASVDVVCARPVVDAELLSSEALPVCQQHREGGVNILSVGVPASKWRRLDRHGSWREFRDAVEAVASAPLTDSKVVADEDTSNGSKALAALQALRANMLGYDAVFVVDWSGTLAAGALWSNEEAEILRRRGKLHYLNFRVFAASFAPPPNKLASTIASAATGLSAQSSTFADHADELGDWQFYAEAESISMLKASTTFALCRGDLDQLVDNAQRLQHGSVTHGAAVDRADLSLHLLVPPLRRDVQELGLANREVTLDEFLAVLKRAAPKSTDTIEKIDWANAVLITSLVRLDPAKEAHRCVDVVARLQKEQRRLGASAAAKTIVYFVAGAKGDSDYAAGVLRRAADATKNVIVAEKFLSAAEMAVIYSRTQLNVHPCRYDAYGMTIIEAAAFGVPSLVQHNQSANVDERNRSLVSTVGAAAELLSCTAAEVVPTDLNSWDETASDDGCSAGWDERSEEGLVDAKSLARALFSDQTASPRAAEKYFTTDAARQRRETAIAYGEDDLARLLITKIAP